MKNKKLLTMALAPALLIGAVGVTSVASTNPVSAITYSSDDDIIEFSEDRLLINPSYDSMYEDFYIMDEDYHTLLNSRTFTSNDIEVEKGEYRIEVYLTNSLSAPNSLSNDILFDMAFKKDNTYRYIENVKATKVNNTKYIYNFEIKEGEEVQWLQFGISINAYEECKKISNFVIYKLDEEEAQVVAEQRAEDEKVKEETEEKEESAVARFFKNIGEFFVKLFRSFIKYICFGWAWDKDGKFEPNWKNWN